MQRVSETLRLVDGLTCWVIFSLFSCRLQFFFFKYMNELFFLKKNNSGLISVCLTFLSNKYTRRCFPDLVWVQTNCSLSSGDTSKQMYVATHGNNCLLYEISE